MKIRNGFVSNSSTSSFVIIYREAELSEIGDPHIYFMGEGYDGLDFFKIENSGDINLLKKYGVPKDYFCNLCYVYFSSEEEEIISIEKLFQLFEEIKNDPKNKGKVNIKSFEADQSSGDDGLSRYYENT